MVRTVLWMLFGLMMAVLLSGVAKAEAWPKCLDEGYLSSFDPRMTPRPCEVVTTARINWAGGHRTLRVIRPTGLPVGNDADLIRRIDETATLIGPAMDKMGGLTVDDITILVSSFVSPREVDGDQIFRKGEIDAEARDMFAHECPVSYFKQQHPGGGDNFVFILSHEIFHCIQFRSWNDLPWDDGWIVEATAEYFAYLAKSEAGPGFIPDFDAHIRSTAIPDMDYPDVVFYLWLGNAYRPPEVKRFIDNARSITYIDPETLMNFGKAYYDQTIQLPFGQRLPSTPQLGPTVAVHGSTILSSPNVKPYTLNSQILTFDRGKTYRLTALPAPGDARTQWREGTAGLSGSMPETISTCDGPRSFHVIRTTTHSDQAGDIRVTAEPAGAAVCECPAGVWQETAESARRYFEQSAVGGPGATTYIAGFRTLTLNADRSGSLAYNSVETRTGQPGSDYWLEQTKTGGTHFTWKIGNGLLLTVLDRSADNLIQLNNVIHTHSGTMHETRKSGAQSIGHRFYCDAAGLHLRQNATGTGTIMDAYRTGFTVDMDFVRIGS